jgi:ABC-2 type transport system permease protein
MSPRASRPIWSLVKLDVRLERWRLLAWVLVLSIMPAIVYRAYTSLFSSSAQRAGLSKAFGSSASLTVIAGPAHDLSTVGGLTAWKCLVFCATLAAIMAITTVVRRTRADEEAGRTELLGSTPLPISAGLAAAVVVGLSSSLLTGVLTTLGLALVGSPLGGALALGAAIGGTGVAFVGIAAVAAQATTTSRAASALALGVLGAAFAVRAVGDTTSLHWLDWASPLGWAEELSPYGDDRLWVLGIFVGFAAGLWALAALLLRRRDLGGGLLPERRGPASAPRSLGGGLGLAWRLDARWLLVWTIGLAAMGAVVGSVTTSLTAFAADNHLLARFLGGTHGSLADLYLAQMLQMLSVLAAAAGVQAVLRAHAEEDAGRAEELLATGLTRVRFLGSHLVVGAFGALVALLAGGLAMAAAAWIAGSPGSTAGMLGGIGVQLLPCLVLVAASVALVGGAPRFSVLALPLVIATYVLTTFGDLLRLPGWVLDLSVYAHTPRLPGGSAPLGTVLALALVALVLTAVGLAAMRRRDLA